VQYEDCIKAQIDGKAYLDINGLTVKIGDLVPDLSSCLLIDVDKLTKEKKLGEVFFDDLFAAKGLFFLREDLALCTKRN
jgi:hypothetical protein